MRAPRALVASLAILAISGPLSRSSRAHPHPPAPMTEEELMEHSTLVVDAVCTHIICDGPAVKEGERIKSTYLSTLAPYKVYKGQPPHPLLIRGFWYDWTSIWYATENQYPIPKGWAGKLYLHDLPDGTYAEVWWNGKVEDLQKAAPEPLPPCVPLVFDLFDSGTPIPFADSRVMTLREDAGADIEGAAVEEPSSGGCSSGGGEGRARSVLWLPALVGLLLLVAMMRERRRMHDE